MILTATHKFDLWNGRYSLLAGGDHVWWMMEREWNYNKPNVSCVPRDEYTLEPHSTVKYPNTWALIGDAVSHQKKEGVPRFACVAHAAVWPTDLEGCFCVCKSIGATGMAVGAPEAIIEFRSVINSAGPTDKIKILMNQ